MSVKIKLLWLIPAMILALCLARPPAVLGTVGAFNGLTTARVDNLGDGTHVPIVETSITSAPAGGGYTNRSGTIAAGGTSQTAAPAKANRATLLLQNPTSATESFWVRVDGVAAVNASPAIEVPPGVTLQLPYVPTGEIEVNAPTTGDAYTIWEG